MTKVIVPVGRVVANNGLTLIECAKAGIGFVRLPSYYGNQEVDEGTLVKVFDDWSVFQRFEYFCITPPSKHMPARTRALISYLKHHLSMPAADAVKDLPEGQGRSPYDAGRHERADPASSRVKHRTEAG